MTTPIDFKNKIAVRYKTEICKNWNAGFCEFGDKCVFAHGSEEIRGKTFYKTKKCRQFFENGYCMFGNKCIFLHVETHSNASGTQDAQKPQPIHQKTEKFGFGPSAKNRLPVFEQIYQIN